MSDVIEFLIENKRKDLVKVILNEIEGKKSTQYYPITFPSPHNPLTPPWYVTSHGGGTQA